MWNEWFHDTCPWDTLSYHVLDILSTVCGILKPFGSCVRYMHRSLLLVVALEPFFNCSETSLCQHVLMQESRTIYVVLCLSLSFSLSWSQSSHAKNRYKEGFAATRALPYLYIWFSNFWDLVWLSCMGGMPVLRYVSREYWCFCSFGVWHRHRPGFLGWLSNFQRVRMTWNILGRYYHFELFGAGVKSSHARRELWI